MVGDTQQLAQYATTMAFLSTTEWRATSLKHWKDSSNVLPSSRFDKGTSSTRASTRLSQDRAEGVAHCFVGPMFWRRHLTILRGGGLKRQ